MAYVNAELNYKIMDDLIQTWNKKGFGKNIQIMYSTPSKYLEAMQEINDDL